MINEEKVKIMTKLAMYEQGKGRKYLPVSQILQKRLYWSGTDQEFFPCDDRICADRGSCKLFILGNIFLKTFIR